MLLHGTVIIERDTDSDHESQDADRFIAQSTLGIIQGCIANNPAPTNSERGERDDEVDEHSNAFSTGLGEQHFISINTRRRAGLKVRCLCGQIFVGNFVLRY